MTRPFVLLPAGVRFSLCPVYAFLDSQTSESLSRAIQIPSHMCLISSSASSSAGAPSHRMRPLPST